MYLHLCLNWLRRLLKLKMSEPLQFNVGILIIGSLLWDERRQEWRESRLDMTSAQTATAPIRYGRRSQTRGNTYTMVFSRECKDGHGAVVRCIHPVSSVSDLISEAEHLWAAEQNTTVGRQISADWGCVTLLCCPDRRAPQSLLTGWANRVAQERNYGNATQEPGEGGLVSAGGLLQIAWPRRVADGAAAPLDFLLATATRPTLTGTPLSYPTVEMIANAWNADTGNHVEYFWKNTDNGIRTFQDDEIRERLRPRGQA
jgi:hypothetical protein